MKKPLLVRVVLYVACSVGLLAAFQAAPDPFVQQLARQLDRFYTGTYPEKSYLHFDKDTYAAGETMWYNAYVVDAQHHRPDTLSRVLYVDLLGPSNKVLEQHALPLKGGVAPGSFVLPDTLSQGTYTVRAYTSWMRNTDAGFFFNRSFTVWSAATRAARRRAAAPISKWLDVQFFPEGGQLVAGLESTVAFKATDAYGHGVDVQGIVEDEAGQKVTDFKSLHLGMGRFQLKPQPGKKYVAVVRQPDGQRLRHPIPEAQPSGFTMRVLQFSNAFQIAVQRRRVGVPLEQVTIVAQARGQLAYVGQSSANDSITFLVRVPKDNFPAGVVHFTLFDGQHVARCERLVFVDSEPGLRLTLQPDKAAYGPREKVTLRVAAADAQGRPVAGHFSLAVNGTELAPFDTATTNIRTHLLLTSDLRGRIEQPGFYFSRNRMAKAALDNLLLTQGWRRFVWQELLANRLGDFPFPLEQTMSVSGQIIGRKQEPAANAAVNLFRFRKGEQGIYETTTDSLGRFLFSGFSGLDTARVLVRAKSGKGMRSPVVKLNRRWPETGPALAPPLPDNDPAKENYLASSQRQQTVERQYGPYAKSIMLRNVTIKGDRVAPDPRRLYARADAVVATKDIPASGGYTNVLQLLQGRVAGVTVSGNGADMQAQIRGVNSLSGSSVPLYLLDGIPVDPSIAASIPVVDVESVEVLKGGSAAIYGSQGGNGVIAIYTKRGNPNYDSSQDPAAADIGSYLLPKFHQAREFYVPPYGTGKDVPPTDFRSATLYWNPTVRTDATGQATVSFFTSDIGGTFRLALEGISQAGTPGVGSSSIQVKGK